MKLIVDTQIGVITGTATGENDLPDGLIYLDPPEGFDITKINDYTLVDGVLTIDPVAALTRAKQSKIRAIRAKYDGIIQGIKATVAAYEVQTWETQRNELVIYLADPTSPTPYVDSLAAARGESRDVLFGKIKVKVENMARLQGTQHALEKQVEAATSLEEVDAVVI